jgi:hypothetical protein
MFVLGLYVVVSCVRHRPCDKLITLPRSPNVRRNKGSRNHYFAPFSSDSDWKQIHMYTTIHTKESTPNIV